jgi:hypothetical protein
VATITRNVAGRIFDAPPIPLATRVLANVEAVAAATMPGAIHPMNARSPRARSVPSVARAAAIGRAASTSTATSPSVGSTTCCREARVTVAEIDTNSRPIRVCVAVPIVFKVAH